MAKKTNNQKQYDEFYKIKEHTIQRKFNKNTSDSSMINAEIIRLDRETKNRQQSEKLEPFSFQLYEDIMSKLTLNLNNKDSLVSLRKGGLRKTEKLFFTKLFNDELSQASPFEMKKSYDLKKQVELIQESLFNFEDDEYEDVERQNLESSSNQEENNDKNSVILERKQNRSIINPYCKYPDFIAPSENSPSSIQETSLYHKLFNLKSKTNNYHENSKFSLNHNHLSSSEICHFGRSIENNDRSLFRSNKDNFINKSNTITKFNGNDIESLFTPKPNENIFPVDKIHDETEISSNNAKTYGHLNTINVSDHLNLSKKSSEDDVSLMTVRTTAYHQHDINHCYQFGNTNGTFNHYQLPQQNYSNDYYEKDYNIYSNNYNSPFSIDPRSIPNKSVTEIKDNKDFQATVKFIENVKSENDTKEICNDLEQAAVEDLVKLALYLSSNTSMILANTHILDIFNFIYQNLDNSKKQSVIKSINFIDISKNESSCKVISLLKLLFSTTEQEMIIKQFKNESKLHGLILNKFGKNVLEWIILNFTCKLGAIEKLLYNKFVEYSSSNNSTYVIQALIKRERGEKILKCFQLGIEQIVEFRNGVFVVTCGLQYLYPQQRDQLLNLIIANFVNFSRKKYASTLVEKIISEYYPYSIQGFINVVGNRFAGKNNLSRNNGR